jgi:hypothetical protein
MHVQLYFPVHHFHSTLNIPCSLVVLNYEKSTSLTLVEEYMLRMFENEIKVVLVFN